MAKGLEANGAKVYIVGRREEALKKAAEQAVSIANHKMGASLFSRRLLIDLAPRNMETSFLSKEM
jgi:hypothetical protein